MHAGMVRIAGVPNALAIRPAFCWRPDSVPSNGYIVIVPIFVFSTDARPLRNDIRRRPNQPEIGSERLERSLVKILKMILHANAILHHDKAEFTHHGLAGRGFDAAICGDTGNNEVRYSPRTQQLIEPSARKRTEPVFGDDGLSWFRAKSFGEFSPPRAGPANFGFILIKPAVE